MLSWHKVLVFTNQPSKFRCSSPTQAFLIARTPHSHFHFRVLAVIVLSFKARTNTNTAVKGVWDVDRIHQWPNELGLQLKTTPYLATVVVVIMIMIRNMFRWRVKYVSYLHFKTCKRSISFLRGAMCSWLSQLKSGALGLSLSVCSLAATNNNK